MDNEVNVSPQRIIEKILELNKEENYQRRARCFVNDSFDDYDPPIDWIRFCEAAKKNGAGKFALEFLLKALEQGVSFGEYTPLLLENKEKYCEISELPYFNYADILCGGNLPYQIICHFPSKKQKSYCYYVIPTENSFIINLFREFVENKPTINKKLQHEVVSNFASSFGEYETKISSLNDIKCQMILEQTEYYRNLFFNDSKKFSNAIFTLYSFYRWLVDKYEDHDFFCSSLKINRKILFSNRLHEFLKEKYFFTLFSPSNVPLNESKIIFLTNGFDKLSTRFLKEDYFKVDLSNMKFSKYRELILKYISVSSVGYTTNTNFHYIADLLNDMFEIKNKASDYPNRNPFHFTAEEGWYIKKKCLEGSLKTINSINNKISYVRHFFRWCEAAKEMTFADEFFEYLSGRVVPPNTSKHIVSDSELRDINEILTKKSETDLKYKLVLAVFHLALQTPFRISHICHMRIDSIQPTLKPGEYKMVSNTKVTGGEAVDHPITEMTFRLVKNIIEETNKIREENCPKTLKNYVFLFRQGTPNTVAVINSTTFGQLFKQAVAEIGIKGYSFSNLRQTRMTKAVEHVIRTGKSDLQLSLFTNHSKSDTTSKYYLDLDMEKMFEATYGVQIGSVNNTKTPNIVDSLPPELLSDESDVEFGCGKCTAKSCEGVAMLSCLICDNFVTTPQHIPFFEKELKRIKQRIIQTDCQHQKEDLITIKTLYVEYLKNIYQHKEESIV